MNSNTKALKIACAVAAVVVAGAAGAVGVGCHLTGGGLSSARAREREPLQTAMADLQRSQGSVSASLVSADQAVVGVAEHTQTAQELVQKAQPHADPVGQAQLTRASAQHVAVLADADSAQRALEQARQDLTSAQEASARTASDLAAARQAVEEERLKRAKLEGQWYVVWGLRVERAFWTAAITWLLVSIGSMLLGLGSPLSWLGRLRGLMGLGRGLGRGSAGGWIGEAFTK